MGILTDILAGIGLLALIGVAWLYLRAWIGRPTVGDP